MPYPNEHSCRIRDPDDFQSESFRRIKEGKLSIIIGRLKGKTETTTQAFRYPIEDWSETEARVHCENQNGSFEPAAKEAAFSFDYMASLEVHDPTRHLAKIMVIDTTKNKNMWQVTDEALKKALGTLVGKPLIAYPDHTGTVEVGYFTDAYAPNGYAVGVAEITNTDAWKKIENGEWRFVSPQVFAYNISKVNGVDLLKDFAFNHVAFVPMGAYPRAQVLETFSGKESSLRSFSAALTEKLEEINKGEKLKMSENAHDKELAEAKATIEKLEAANKNLRELLEQKTKTPYEVEIAKLRSQIEHFQADNEKLSESLRNFEAERHQAKVQELLGLRANLGFTPSNEELERFQAMTDDILNQLIEDTKDLSDRGSYTAIPKAKYTGDRRLSTEDRVRLRLLGHVKEGE